MPPSPPNPRGMGIAKMADNTERLLLELAEQVKTCRDEIAELKALLMQGLSSTRTSAGVTTGGSASDAQNRLRAVAEPSPVEADPET